MKISVVDGSFQHRVHGSFSPVVNQANTGSCTRSRPLISSQYFTKRLSLVGETILQVPVLENDFYLRALVWRKLHAKERSDSHNISSRQTLNFYVEP